MSYLRQHYRARLLCPVTYSPALHQSILCFSGPSERQAPLTTDDCEAEGTQSMTTSAEFTTMLTKGPDT